MDPINQESKSDKVSPWLKAIRLRTLPLSVSGILLGTALAYYAGGYDGFLLFLTLGATIGLQILSNLANDYGDGIKGTDDNDRIGPERTVQSGAISPSAMLNGIRITVLFTIIFIIFAVFRAFGINFVYYSIFFFILGGLAVFAAIRYTVGNQAYGYRALGDIMVFIFFGIVSVLGTFFLQAKAFDAVTILPAVTIGLLSVGVLNLNNMRDIESDRKSNKITVALKLGWQKAKRYHSFLIITAMISGLTWAVLFYRTPLHFLFMITYIPLIRHLIFIWRNESPEKLDSQLKVVALSTFVLSVLMGIGHIYLAL